MHSTPGKCWSVAELGALAEGVGFVDVAHRPAAGDRGVLLARKPEAVVLFSYGTLRRPEVQVVREALHREVRLRRRELV